MILNYKKLMLYCCNKTINRIKGVAVIIHGLQDVRDFVRGQNRHWAVIFCFLVQSSDESDGSANALVEAAIKDVAEEDLVRARSAMKALNIPQALLRHVSGETLDRLGSTASKEGQSPIRVTPAASRQASSSIREQFHCHAMHPPKPGLFLDWCMNVPYKVCKSISNAMLIP